MHTPIYLFVALASATLAAAVPIGPRWIQALLGLDGETGKKKLTFDGNGNFKVDLAGLEHICEELIALMQVVSFSDMHFGERWGMWRSANVRHCSHHEHDL